MDVHYGQVFEQPFPTDTLQLGNGGTVSLAQFGDRVKVILFTSEYCGACEYAYPIINAIYDDYSADSVAVFGVLWNTYDEMQPGALKSLAESKNIRFPLAMDNGRFY